MENSKVKIGDTEWTVIYRPIMFYKGQYKSVIILKNKKQIYVSLKDKDRKNYEVDTLSINFQKAILPLIVEEAKKKFNVDDVDESLKLMKENKYV